MQNYWKKYGKEMRLFRSVLALLLVSYATCAYSASKTVLVLGDSLSAEYGIARSTGWVALLGKRLQADKIDANIINASISGETTSGGKARLPALLEQHHPDVLILELGGNDGLRGLPLASTEANLRAMIKDAQKAKARVLLVGMQIPPNYGRDYAEKFFGLYAKLSRETKVSLAPFLLDGVADSPQLLQPDRIHPLAEAEPIMLNNIWPHLKPLLTSK
ncbi:arylesterase [Herbaspirillum sp. ST 5-3]|uniref:arylesterase n=1 Tax=Oxalobacteraceae TaxID=75682 RepID=UPI0010A52F9C|nr:arylesterase [Herbaspirillum sp. ST 5-3]